MTTTHQDHQLISAEAKRSRVGFVTFVLCLDCRVIVAEHGASARAHTHTKEE